MTLDLRRPDFFDVARPRQIEVSPGDKILIRANDKRLGLTNGQVLTVSGIAPDGALQTKEANVFGGLSAMVSRLRRYLAQSSGLDRRPRRYRRRTPHPKEPTSRALEVVSHASYTPRKDAPDRKIARGKSSCRIGCALRNSP